MAGGNAGPAWGVPDGWSDFSPVVVSTVCSKAGRTGGDIDGWSSFSA